MKFTRRPEDQDAQGGGAASSTLPLQTGTPRDVPPAMPRRSPPTIPSRNRDYGSDPSEERSSVGNFREGNRLVVGRDISLSGKISSCEKLVVEGNVEADITDCRELEISEGGSFNGSAQVEIAEIAGDFSGSVTASDLLILRSTGRITGNISYRRLEVERGGEMSGDVQALAGDSGS